MSENTISGVSDSLLNHLIYSIKDQQRVVCNDQISNLPKITSAVTQDSLSLSLVVFSFGKYVNNWGGALKCNTKLFYNNIFPVCTVSFKISKAMASNTSNEL